MDLNFRETFISAVTSNDFEMLDSLIKDKKVDIDQYLDGGSTALHLAIRSNQLPMARFLLEHKANANVTYGAETCSRLDVKNGFFKTDQLILMHILEKIKKGHSTVIAPLHLAVKLNYQEITELLLQYGANPNVASVIGMYPINYAIFNSNLTLIRLLLKHGADPNCSHGCGIAFHDKFVLKNEEVRNLFLAHGADVFAMNSKGRNILFYAVVECDRKFVETLLQMGVDANHADRKRKTALHNLLRNYMRMDEPEDVVAKVKLLIDYGADVNALSSKNVTPLFYAAVHPFADRRHLYPLFGAMCFDRIEVIDYLISKGARLDATGPDGNTLLQDVMKHVWCVDKQLAMRIVKLLMANGLSISGDDCKDLRNDSGAELDALQSEYDSMKATVISKDSRATYLDLLLKRRNALVHCLRHSEIRELVNAGEYKSLFPIFSERVAINLSRGFKRMQLLDEFAIILSEILVNEFPNELIKLIVQYLDDEDLVRALV